MIAPTAIEVQAYFPDWEVKSFKGKGTYKAAYEAVRGGNVEALKLFLVPDFDDDEEGEMLAAFLGRFTRELRLLRDCRTSALVKLGSLDPMQIALGGKTYIAYSEALLNGSTLQALIANGIRGTEPELVGLLKSLVNAISELWDDHRCVHRDIKPGNIVKCTSGEEGFVLLDLGVSFEADGTRLTSSGVTSPGTPAYRAPEMLEVDYADKLDARTDLYCAGVTAFEFASGVHPLGPFTTGSVEGRILNHPPTRLASLRPDLSPWICDLIDRLNRKRTTLRGNLPLIRRELGIL